jgi:hypothetical protein
MNEIKKKLYSDKYCLLNKWIGRAEAYRDAAKDASYCNKQLATDLRKSMGGWGKIVAREIKETK